MLAFRFRSKVQRRTRQLTLAVGVGAGVNAPSKFDKVLCRQRR